MPSGLKIEGFRWLTATDLSMCASHKMMAEACKDETIETVQRPENIPTSGGYESERNKKKAGAYLVMDLLVRR